MSKHALKTKNGSGRYVNTGREKCNARHWIPLRVRSENGISPRETANGKSFEDFTPLFDEKNEKRSKTKSSEYVERTCLENSLLRGFLQMRYYLHCCPTVHVCTGEYWVGEGCNFDIRLSL